MIIVLILVFILFCRREEFSPPGIWGGCPDHCNCAVYNQDGKWLKCQRARMKSPCQPHHKNRVCRNASNGMDSKETLFKVSCCGASCGQPGHDIGHSLQCVKEDGKWKGYLHNCAYAGEDLRCHK